MPVYSRKIAVCSLEADEGIALVYSTIWVMQSSAKKSPGDSGNVARSSMLLELYDLYGVKIPGNAEKELLALLVVMTSRGL
jgi:hypothetical protein